MSWSLFEFGSNELTEGVRQLLSHDVQTEAVVEIACEPTVALRRLAFETERWWPSCYAWRPRSADARPSAVGASWCDLGQIVHGAPAVQGALPAHLAVIWDLGHGSPAACEVGGVVDVVARQLSAGCSQVRVRHRWAAPLNPQARFLHELLSSPQGWTTILAAYAAIPSLRPGTGAAR